MLGSGCPWEPFVWGSPKPRPHGDSHVLCRCQRGWKMEHQLCAPARLGAPCDWGHFPAPPLVPMPWPDPGQAGQAEAAQAGAWPSMGREGSCTVFSMEVAVVLLLAVDSITALYCFSWLLKISLGLASSMSGTASLSHLLPSPMSQGTLSSKEVHQHAPWGLGRKTFPHPGVCEWVWPRQGVPGSAMKTHGVRARKGGVLLFYVGTSLQHNRTTEQCCPHTAALYPHGGGWCRFFTNQKREWVLLSYISGKYMRLMFPGQQQQKKQMLFEPGQVVAVLP